MDPANEQNDALSRVTLDAARRNIPLEIVPRAAAASLREAADLLGIEPERLVKTLVLKRSDGSFLFVLVPGGRAMSWPKLRALLSVNKLSLPNEQAAFEVTGISPGHHHTLRFAYQPAGGCGSERVPGAAITHDRVGERGSAPCPVRRSAGPG